MTFTGTFHENMYVLGLSPPADTDASTFPAAGYYVDVSDFNRFMFMVYLGSMASSGDFRVWSATTATGALIALSGAEKTDQTLSTDNNKWFTIEVETARLPSSHHLVALKVTSETGTNLWSAMFFGWECRHGSPTQSTGYDSHTVIAG